MRPSRLVGQVPAIAVRAIVTAAGLNGAGPKKRRIRVVVPPGIVARVIVLRRPLVHGGYRWEARCPRCPATRRRLYVLGGELGCAGCHGLRYVSWAMSRTTWYHEIWLPVRRAR